MGRQTVNFEQCISKLTELHILSWPFLLPLKSSSETIAVIACCQYKLEVLLFDLSSKSQQVILHWQTQDFLIFIHFW